MIDANLVGKIIWTAFVYAGCGHLAFRLGERAGKISVEEERDRRGKLISRKCSFNRKDKK